MADERLPIYYLDRLGIKVSSDEEFSDRLIKKAEQDDVRVELLNKVWPQRSPFAPKFGPMETGFTKHDVIMTCQKRAMTLIIEDVLYQIDINEEAVEQKLKSFYNLICKTDKKFAPQSEEHAKSGLYAKLLFEEYEAWCERENEIKSIASKRELRQEAKKKVQRKYKLHAFYTPVSMNDQDNTPNLEIYECVKTVYTIGTNIVNVVVMRRDGGIDMNSRKRTLTPHDCKILHIKYQKGLYMFNMNMRFYPVKEDILKLRTLTG